MAIKRLHVWLFLPHAIDALGISIFVNFMIYWPHFEYSGPPYLWHLLIQQMMPGVGIMVLFVFAIDSIPTLLACRFLADRLWAFGVAPLPFFSALMISLTAAAIAWLKGADAILIAFYLFHLVPIFLFELLVRALWIVST